MLAALVQHTRHTRQCDGEDALGGLEELNVGPVALGQLLPVVEVAVELARHQVHGLVDHWKRGLRSIVQLRLIRNYLRLRTWIDGFFCADRPVGVHGSLGRVVGAVLLAHVVNARAHRLLVENLYRKMA